MLFIKKSKINIENVSVFKNAIEEKCEFKGTLFGVYFYYPETNYDFDGKYCNRKLFMYYKGIRRTLFNPLIIIDFLKCGIFVEIRYNKFQKAFMGLFSFIFTVFGIIGILQNVIIAILPLFIFWTIIISVFYFYANVIEKALYRYIDQSDQSGTNQGTDRSGSAQGTVPRVDENNTGSAQGSAQGTVPCVD